MTAMHATAFAEHGPVLLGVTADGECSKQPSPRPPYLCSRCFGTLRLVNANTHKPGLRSRENHFRRSPDISGCACNPAGSSGGNGTATALGVGTSAGQHSIGWFTNPSNRWTRTNVWHGSLMGRNGVNYDSTAPLGILERRGTGWKASGGRLAHLSGNPGPRLLAGPVTAGQFTAVEIPPGAVAPVALPLRGRSLVVTPRPVIYLHPTARPHSYMAIAVRYDGQRRHSYRLGIVSGVHPDWPAWVQAAPDRCMILAPSWHQKRDLQGSPLSITNLEVSGLIL